MAALENAWFYVLTAFLDRIIAVAKMHLDIPLPEWYNTPIKPLRKCKYRWQVPFRELRMVEAERGWPVGMGF